MFTALKNKDFLPWTAGRLATLAGGVVLLYAGAPVADEAAVANSLRAVFPDIEISRIHESRMPGIYEVMLGTDVIYASEDGRYVIQGDLLDLKDRRNISEDIREAARKDLLGRIPMNETINFFPTRPQHTVYVFTDVTCGFCRRLHRDVPRLNRMGIAVRYLAFPRAGIDSAAFREMESVWCAPDPRKAITDAKLGKPVVEAHCPNPVAGQFELGRRLGVRGTPAIFLENGRLLSGYLTPEELQEEVQKK